MKIVLLWAFIFLSAGAIQAGNEEFGGKIAFLRSGEVWVADPEGRNSRRITDTGGKIEDFLFSPSLRFLAYSKRIKTVEEPGLYEKGEKPPLRSVCSIVILDLKSLTPRTEMIPPEGEWIYLDKWVPKDRLLGHSSSGFDVAGFFVIDAPESPPRELDYQQGALLVESDFTLDGSLQAYVKDSGLGKDFKNHLYLVNLKTRGEKLLVSRRSILSPQISPDKSQTAFLEVENHDKKGFDTLWVYDLRKDLLKKLHHGPAKPKFAGVSDLAWSLDGKHIAMFFPSQTLVLEIENPAQVYKIGGNDLSWVSNRSGIYSRENKLFRYSLETRKAEPFLENAAHPAFLARP
ncbi:MAG: Tol-Pal system beta propeller repeat protein TolB [Deltaproteobacteria bacterium]|nr:Tol-Pal system beta propeller repeat protein TolB [Deltaproteobacteria bacterium]